MQTLQQPTNSLPQIIKSWNGKTIRFRAEDQYGSLTDMAQATGKLTGHWLENKSTKEYLTSLSALIGIPITELVQVLQGGAPENQGTWAHRRVCLRFAQWCSADFAVQVDSWVEELLTKGTVSLALPHDYLSALKALVQSEEEKQCLLVSNELLEIQADFYADKLEEAEDTLEVYRAITSDQVTLSLKQVADALKIKKLGRNNLAKYLRTKSFLVQNGTAPMRSHIEADHAVSITTSWTTVGGVAVTNQTTHVTFKGLSWLIKNLLADGYDVQTTAALIWDSYNAVPEEALDLVVV